MMNMWLQRQPQWRRFTIQIAIDDDDYDSFDDEYVVDNDNNKDIVHD